MPSTDLIRLHRLANHTPGAISTEWGELWHPANELGGAGVEIRALREALAAPPDGERLFLAYCALACLVGVFLVAAFHMPLGWFVLVAVGLGVVSSVLCYLVTPRNRLPPIGGDK